MLRENGESNIMTSVVLCSATEYCLGDQGGFRGINKLSKQSWTADKGCSSSLGVGRGANNPSL